MPRCSTTGGLKLSLELPTMIPYFSEDTNLTGSTVIDIFSHMLNSHLNLIRLLKWKTILGSSLEEFFLIPIILLHIHFPPCANYQSTTYKRSRFQSNLRKKFSKYQVKTESSYYSATVALRSVESLQIFLVSSDNAIKFR